VPVLLAGVKPASVTPSEQARPAAYGVAIRLCVYVHVANVLIDLLSLRSG